MDTGIIPHFIPSKIICTLPGSAPQREHSLPLLGSRQEEQGPEKFYTTEINIS
jgi:hypothetical protein